ncbi:hypothetical protein GCM10007382_17270 [Salinibacterium xinjiangense]|nr:hypothetical protein GCM10007382_17270 [Salinibacterium xinjiangense]
MDVGHGNFQFVQETAGFGIHSLTIHEPSATRELPEEHVCRDIETLDECEILEHRGYSRCSSICGAGEADELVIDEDLTVILMMNAADRFNEG